MPIIRSLLAKRPRKRDREHQNTSLDIVYLSKLPMDKLIEALLALDAGKIKMEQPEFDDRAADYKRIMFKDAFMFLTLWNGPQIEEKFAQIFIKGRQLDSSVSQKGNPKLYGKADDLFHNWFKTYNDTIGMDWLCMSYNGICKALQEELPALSVKANEGAQEYPIFIIDDALKLSYTITDEYDLNILDEFQKRKFTRPDTTDQFLVDLNEIGRKQKALDRAVQYANAKEDKFPELYWQCAETVYGQNVGNFPKSLIALYQKYLKERK